MCIRDSFYTKHSKEMYDFLKDVLDLHYVDAGNGRLFFAAPPTELAVHETEDDSEHELWLICGDIAATVQQLEKKGIKTTPVADRGWGLVTTLELLSLIHILSVLASDRSCVPADLEIAGNLTMRKCYGNRA